MQLLPALRAVRLIFLVALAAPATAMTVVPPTFPELVAEASAIVRARVTHSESRKVAGSGGGVIKTFVTFQIASSLKGTPEREVTLSFLGGQVGDENLHVPGMPSFEVGAEEYLFVSRTKGVCPLVGAMHGRYHVFTPQKAGRPYVIRNDGSPLVRVADVMLPMGHDRTAHTLDGESALSPEDFERLIVSELSRQSSRNPQP